jgi:putative lumazine-binding protein
VVQQKQGENLMSEAQRTLNNAATNLTEYDAIAKTVQHYIEGGKSGRTDEMKRAFHPDATIYGYLGPDLFGGPIQLLLDWNDKNGPATELQGRIVSVNVFETIATVRLELDNWTGARFTDMFTLLKIDGEWKIMSKVFYHHP